MQEKNFIPFIAHIFYGVSGNFSCFSWFIKFVKELYGKKTGKEDRRPRYLLNFDFISGFNNHFVSEEIIHESK